MNNQTVGIALVIIGMLLALSAWAFFRKAEYKFFMAAPFTEAHTYMRKPGGTIWWAGHYCPVKLKVESILVMCDRAFRAKKGGVDLNGDGQFVQASGIFPGGRYECRQDAVRSAHGFPAVDDVRSICRSL